jgi:hypothetical protein
MFNLQVLWYTASCDCYAVLRWELRCETHFPPLAAMFFLYHLRETFISLCSGTFPNLMKIAKVQPIHKKGGKQEISNYTPISILPVFFKTDFIFKMFITEYLSII